jgi:hypothetical protein
MKTIPPAIANHGHGIGTAEVLNMSDALPKTIAPIRALHAASR